MKQIFCRLFGIGSAMVLLILLCGIGSGFADSEAKDEKTYRITTLGTISSPGSSHDLTGEDLEQFGYKEIGSAYFDRAMDYRNSRFRVISFSSLLDRYDQEKRSTAVLLNCFDDYQGILPVSDIRRFDLQLATRIEIGPGYRKPNWLNPLLVIVPDGSPAPFEERFLTANIRELRFVRMEEYYAPLEKVIRKNPGVKTGFTVFKNNCLFCHSLKGVGGNKGKDLLRGYFPMNPSNKFRFLQDFTGFHHAKNPDKQNVEQFVSPDQLDSIWNFLKAVRSLGNK